MTITFYSDKLAADAAVIAAGGGDVSFRVGLDGRPLQLPWCATTGADYQPPPAKTEIPLSLFRERLTTAETDAILAASSTDPIIRRAIWQLSSQTDGMLHLDDPRVGQTLSYLVSQGLLTSDRPAQLLA